MDQNERAPIEKREPSRLIGALVALSIAIFGLLTVLGVTYSPDLPVAVERVIYAVGGIVVIVAPIIQAELTRQRVWSPASHDQQLTAAKERALRAHGVSAAQIAAGPDRRRVQRLRRTAIDPDGDGVPNP